MSEEFPGAASGPEENQRKEIDLDFEPNVLDEVSRIARGNQEDLNRIREDLGLVEKNESSAGPTEEKIGEVPQNEVPIRERIDMPHIAPLSKILKKEFGPKADPEAIQNILNVVLEEIVGKTEVYKSGDIGASFPYTCIDTGIIAEKLYAEFKGQKPEVKEEGKKETKEEKEFFFGAVQTVQSGSPFGFFEETLHKIILDLPGALEKLSRGERPDQHEIYVLGTPTNELGEISHNFLEKMQNGKAYDAFGDLYSEFIKSQIPQDEDEKQKLKISFHGISMGASFATETAEKLINERDVTQDRQVEEGENIPFLEVRIDTPPGPNKHGQGWKMLLGFIADSTYTMFRDPYIKEVMLSDKKFLSQVNAVLGERGIPINMTPEQTKNKKEAIWRLIMDLKNGVPAPVGLKFTEVIGTNDILMYSPEFNRRVKEQKEKADGSLGQNLVEEKRNRRTFATNERHSKSYLRKNELRRIQHTIELLKNLKN